MNKKTMKITLISILISSTLFNMTNNTLANTEDDIEENNPEEYIKEQSEGDEFEESTYESENDTYESETTTETIETYNQKSTIEDAAGEVNENEENSSVPEQETYEVNSEESELDENDEGAPDADQEPVDEPATETEAEADNNLLVPEENHDETTPEDSQEETENNPEDVPEDNTEESVNDNNDNNQSEQENQENIDNEDDVDNDTPIDDDPVDLTPGAGENNDDTGDINAGSGSGDNNQTGSEQDTGSGEYTDDGTSGNGNQEDVTDNEDSEDENLENSNGNQIGDDLPVGSEGTAEPDTGNIPDETSDAVDEQPGENVIESGQENLEPEVQEPEAEKGQNSGVAGKKLYRYNYGDILNGIDLNPGMTEENLSTLDKRINRIMTSKIVGETDMTDEEILEIEEEIKNESGVVSSSSDRDALPNTGDTNQYNFIYSFVLILAGGILFFLTKRPENDQ